MTLLIFTHPIEANNNNISNSMTELRVSKYTRPILTSIHKKQKSFISLFFKTDKKEPKKNNKSKYGYESAKVLPAKNIKKSKTRSSRLKKRHRLKNCEKKHSKRKCHRRRKRKMQREKAKMYRRKDDNKPAKITCCFKI